MRGPGTLVVTVWTSGCGSRKAAREPRVSTVGAAKPSIPVSSSTPAAWPVLASPGQPTTPAALQDLRHQAGAQGLWSAGAG